MGTINTSMQAVQKAQIDLGEVDDLPPLGQDMVLYTLLCALCNMKSIICIHHRTPITWYVCVPRHPRCGSRTKWMSQNTRSTPRLMLSLQEQPLWSTSQLVSGADMTQLIVLFFGA